MTYHCEPFRFMEIQETLFQETQDPLLDHTESEIPLDDCMFVRGFVISEFSEQSAEIVELREADIVSNADSAILRLAS